MAIWWARLLLNNRDKIIYIFYIKSQKNKSIFAKILKYIKLISIYFFGPAYIYIGISHFTEPDYFLSIIPNYMSFHLELVYLSGFFEILLGFMLLFNKYRTIAAKGVILLLIGVFPANIYLAQSTLAQSILEITKETAIIRLPFQAVFLLFAYWFTKK